MNPATHRTLRQHPLRYELTLSSFEAIHAADIAGWVRTKQELHWVAPSTSWPLTPAKVAAWSRPLGRAFVLTSAHSVAPLGYGELNPMRQTPTELWLGHVIVRPDRRGEGLGLNLVHYLIDEAFGRMEAQRILLIVFPDNAAAIRCYLRAGFKVTGDEFHRFSESREGERLLRLEIDAAQSA